MGYKVFISSAGKDIDLARDLEQRLKVAGIDVRTWHASFAAGESIPKEVHKNISHADEVVVILSDDSVNNPSLMFELGAASSMRKRVTPVVVGLDSSNVPSLIKNLKYIKYPDLGGYITDLEERAKAAA
jgi:hypothetical protein